jgi:hypothetical protein
VVAVVEDVQLSLEEVLQNPQSVKNQDHPLGEGDCGKYFETQEVRD